MVLLPGDPFINVEVSAPFICERERFQRQHGNDQKARFFRHRF
jgi:hypothetical protein